jgi:intracellular sulfur oxidation DsrE/DsrF family protein
LTIDEGDDRMLKAVLHLDVDPSPSRYTITQGFELARANIMDLRAADPEAEIIVVMTTSAVCEAPNFKETIARWSQQGISFFMCGLAMQRHEVTSVPGAKIAPYGLAFIVELQMQGYAYIKVTSFRH